MSSLATAALRGTTTRSRRREAPRPVLKVVPAGAPSHGGMLMVCAGLLLSGLLALLFLNTALAEGSFKVHELTRTAGALADQEAAIEQRITALSSPAALAARASGLGMVPAESPAFLRLQDGAVLGVAAPANEESTFSVLVKPPHQVSTTSSLSLSPAADHVSTP
ncbi:MAG: hypothetical protein Q4G67_02135 [Actinomycetia bacterium]|nr:hypothetical protein [Actinomycetes bacterium]